ncbi:MAG: peptidase S41, partial [Burkholderiales bacterium]
YPWLEKTTLDTAIIETKLRTLRTLGAPYSDAEIAGAKAELSGKTELDAMVAYLQVLGTALKNTR